MTQNGSQENLVRLNLDWYKDIIGETPKELTMISAESLVTNHVLSESLEDKWIENYRANKELYGGSHLPSFEAEKKQSNRTAVLVGGSPAIHKNMHQLANLGDDFVVIPCNTSIKPALEAGVTPSYVFSVEGRDHIYDDMDIGREDLTLIASPFISPRTLANWKGPVKFFLIGGGKKWGPHLEEDLGGNESIEISGGNVVSTAMLWAYKFLRIRHFIFTGMSLCYYDKYYHDGRSVAQVENEKEKWNFMNVLDMYGGIAKSTYPLLLYKQWLESYTRYVTQYGGSITNSTEDGILGVLPEVINIEGTKMQVKPTYLPWINILPLEVALTAHRRRMEVQNDSTHKLR